MIILGFIVTGIIMVAGAVWATKTPHTPEAWEWQQFDSRRIK